VPRICECDDEPLGSIKGWEFLDQLLKKESASCSLVRLVSSKGLKKYALFACHGQVNRHQQ
jgi:hypothetical protein